VLAAKGAELIAARPDIPIRPRKVDLDRLDFTEVGTRDTNGVMKPMRFRWLFHKRGELKRGDENEDVKLWQEFLILNTFEIGDMDGKFGPLVEKATKEFQAKVGLPANGIVDEDLQRMADFDVFVPVEVPITPLEAEALAALTPTVSQGHESRAREVNRLIGEALPTSPAGATPASTKKFPDGAYGTIHCDSHPGLGPFFVWFASFATPKPDVEDEID
jgi:peptidoglycan hydrolase-like protein with peptidoglycan-binding domain